VLGGGRSPQLRGRRARAIRSLLLKKTAAFYADEPEPAVSWQAAEGVDPDEDDVKTFLAAWAPLPSSEPPRTCQQRLSAWTGSG
jgi:hypothetical protein